MPAKGVSINLETAKTIADWCARLWPIPAIIITLYIQSDKTVDRTKQDSAQIEKLNARLDAMQNELNKTNIAAATLAQQLLDAKEYGALTSKHGN